MNGLRNRSSSQCCRRTFTGIGPRRLAAAISEPKVFHRVSGDLKDAETFDSIQLRFRQLDRCEAAWIVASGLPIVPYQENLRQMVAYGQCFEVETLIMTKPQ